jgi:hypothetical protein
MKNTSALKINLEAVTSYVTASKLALAGSIVGFGIFGVNPAHAASLNNNTGISNPATTITFAEAPTDTPLTDRYSSLGVTFSNLERRNGFGFPNMDSFAAGNIVASPFTIVFTQSQTRAAFSLATTPRTSTFEALLNNSVVESFSNATSLGANNFYGFTGVTFDTIRVTPGGSDNTVYLDNLQFGNDNTQNVPEPFSIIGTIVGGTAAFRIRKKLADANKA